MASDNDQWRDEELRILLLLYRTFLVEGEPVTCKMHVAKLWRKIFPNWTWTSSSLDQIENIEEIADEVRDATLLWIEFQYRYRLDIERASNDIWTEIERPNLRRQDQYEEDECGKFKQAGNTILRFCTKKDMPRETRTRSIPAMRKYLSSQYWPSVEATKMRDLAKAGEDVPDPYNISSSESEGEGESEGGIEVHGGAQYLSNEAREEYWALRQVEEAELREAIEASKADEPVNRALAEFDERRHKRREEESLERALEAVRQCEQREEAAKRQNEGKPDDATEEEPSNAALHLIAQEEHSRLVRECHHERFVLFRNTLIVVGRSLVGNDGDGTAGFDAVRVRINDRLTARGEQHFAVQEARSALQTLHRIEVVHYENEIVRPIDNDPGQPQRLVRQQARTSEIKPAEMREQEDEMVSTGERSSREPARRAPYVARRSPEDEDMDDEDAVDLDSYDFDASEPGDDDVKMGG